MTISFELLDEEQAARLDHFARGRQSGAKDFRHPVYGVLPGNADGGGATARTSCPSDLASKEAHDRVHRFASGGMVASGMDDLALDGDALP